jgi:heme/copper-type cytochrome/quinol oxidase subunit 2
MGEVGAFEVMQEEYCMPYTSGMTTKIVLKNDDYYYYYIRKMYT